MEVPNRIEVKIAAGVIDETDCAKCPARDCHWDHDFGCAFVWYNLFKQGAKNTEQANQPDSGK